MTDPIDPQEKRRRLREAALNGILISVLVSLILFAPEIIGEKRLERRLEWSAEHG